MPELPYFPFYVSDWLGDSKVKLMNHEEKGAYIDLLAFAWDHGHVPAAEADRARVLGISPQQLRKLWPRLAPCFISDGNGGLVNPKQETIRKRQRQKQKAGGSGGKAKANG